MAAGTADTDAVNVAQLKRARVELTNGTNTTVNSTNDQTDGHVIYSVDVKTNGTIKQGDTNIVTGDTVYNALQNVSWTAKVNGTDAKTVAKDGTLNFIDGNNIAITSTDNGDIKISTTGLASTGDLWTAQAGGKAVKAVDQKVNFNSTDKHLVVESTQDGEITFATKDLADTSFTNITKEGNTYIKNLAKGEDVHIEAREYAVNNDGSVTMTYVDGNGNTVGGTAKIKGIAKSDLTNITEGGKNVINNLAKKAVKVVKGTNTTVTEGISEDGKTKTYAVNVDNAAIQAATDVTGEKGISVTSAVENGVKKYTVSAKLSNNFAIDQATGNIDLAPSISVGKTNPVTINGNTGEITGLSNKTTTAANFADGSGRAATEEQLKEVNSKATAAKTTVTAGKNIEVKGQSDENGSAYTVALADDVSLGNGAIQLKGSDGSISAKSGGAQLAFNNSGLTVSQAKNGLTNETRIDGATITVDGGAGNQTIINGSTARIGSVLVNGGSGTATISGLTNQTTKYDGFANGSGRAATEEQLKEVNSKATAAKTTVTAGKNIAVNGKSDENGSTYTVALADDVSLGNNAAIQLKGTDGSISATSGTSSLNFNGKGLSLSNGKDSTVINGGTISGTQATFGDIKLNTESGTSTISGLSNTRTDYTGFATAGRAATEEQLKEVAGQAGEAIETAGKGWNLTTNKGTATNIAPDGTVDFSSGNDNLVISNAGADLSFSLSDNLDLTKNDSKKGSVKVGENTALMDELLQVGKDVSLSASALNVGNSSLTTSALMVGGLTYISSSGLNANGRVISNVAAGIADTDAVNVGQLKSAISGSQVSIKAGEGIIVEKTGNEYKIKTNIEGLSNEHGTVHVSTDSDSSVVTKSDSTASGTVTPKRSRLFGTMLLAAEIGTTAANTTTTEEGKKLYIKYSAETETINTNDGTITLNDGEAINIHGDDKNITTTIGKKTDDNNKEYDTISVKLNDDIKVQNVTSDKVTINNGPTIDSSGINMNNQKITNLADGEIAEGSKDAVNGGQLYNTNQAVIANAENINSLSHSLNKLDSRINRVGAGAAALAALHPLDFDPDNKWDFAAGYGNYAGANAVAIGTYYRPNENTMFSIGGSFGGGENMINAGVSFKLGSGGSGITTSKTVMAKKIKEQDELLKAQDAKMKEQDEKIAKLEALVAQQGEMIQQALGKK
ncbi:YadA-like family protein [Megasphaera sp.]|uniref:YadA-like family protein n=1 Tax=Megasphaera sp. TaxID=2023260 RepID=UPI0025BACEBF|nr:YadA-like family protein [Megasphaera sp.]